VVAVEDRIGELALSYYRRDTVGLEVSFRCLCVCVEWGLDVQIKLQACMTLSLMASVTRSGYRRN